MSKKLSKLILVMLTGALLALACVKVKRNYKTTLPAQPSAAVRSQQAVFELRNSIVASISPESVQDILQQFKEEYSGKDIVDEKQPSQKPQRVLGGELETKISKVVTNVCIKDIAVKAAGRGPMTFSVAIQTCGFNVKILGAKASLRFRDQLSSKPMQLSIAEFRLKDTLGVRSFTVIGDLQVDSSGALKLGGHPRLEGLESLSDPGSYEFQAVGTDVDGIADKIKKTREQLTAEVVKGVLSMTQGYLESSIREGATRAFRKFSAKFNDRGINLANRSYIFRIAGTTYGVSANIGGIYGEKILSTAMSLHINEIATSTTDDLNCKVDSFENFPDPGANWMRGNPIVKAFSDQVSAPSSTLMLKGAVMVPFSLIDYGLWKVLGSKGTCQWEVSGPSGAKDKVSLRYLSPWSFNVSVQGDGQQTTTSQSLVSLRIPELSVQLPKFLKDEVQSILRKNNFITASEDILQDLRFNDLRYTLAVLVNPTEGDRPARIAVLDEEIYLPRTKIQVEDIVGDLVRSLQRSPTFSSLNIEKKRTEVAQILISSVLNTYLAKTFRDTPIEALEQSAEGVILRSFQILQDSLVVGLGKVIEPITPTKLGGVRKDPSGLDTVTGLTSIADGGEITDLAAQGGLVRLGLPSIVGRNITEAPTDIERQLTGLGFLCRSDKALTLPVDDWTSSSVVYMNCLSKSMSQEHRIHAELPSTDQPVQEGPVVYMRTLLQPKGSGEGLPMTFLQVVSELGKPNVASEGKGGFMAQWSFQKLQTLVHGVCKIESVPCADENKLVTSIEQWHR